MPPKQHVHSKEVKVLKWKAASKCRASSPWGEWGWISEWCKVLGRDCSKGTLPVAKDGGFWSCCLFAVFPELQNHLQKWNCLPNEQKNTCLEVPNWKHCWPCGIQSLRYFGNCTDMKEERLWNCRGSSPSCNRARNFNWFLNTSVSSGLRCGPWVGCTARATRVEGAGGKYCGEKRCPWC